jgi:hypothetical protein
MGHTTTNHPALSRRDWLRLSAAGALGPALSGWLPALARAGANDPKRKRACILLWMNGGPSQLDTFDPKPDHENGGEFKTIETNVPGIRVSEVLPGVAKHMDRLAVVRSLTTGAFDHGRASHLMRTGYARQGGVAFPVLGSLVARDLGAGHSDLPDYVSINAGGAILPGPLTPGFLGPKYAPFVIGESSGADPAAQLQIPDLDASRELPRPRSSAREALRGELEREFLDGRLDPPGQSFRAAYHRAVTLMHSKAARAFDLTEEKDALKDRYGRNLFGQGSLLARRLVERGVSFVEVSLDGWDTHAKNFRDVKVLCGALDPAWSALMADLKDRGLLDTTTVVWAGEFGRTPAVNRDAGRDHWGRGWSVVLGGGGIKGSQVIGSTSKDGTEVKERPLTPPDLLATVGLALGLDITKETESNSGRPIRLVDSSAKPIREVLV